MKKFERKDKNEKRRVLLYKNHELSRTFDNEKLLHDAEAVQGNGVGVMAKVGALTRKQLRALIAILVAICVVVPSFVFVTLHGKAEDVSADYLNFGSDNRLVVGPEGLPSGSYLKNIDGKDYTYNLDRDYTYGDVLTYNPDTKIITADHDPAQNSNLTNLAEAIEPSHIVDNGSTITISFSGNDKLNPNTNYYYYDGAKYYMFSFQDEIIGRIDGDNYDANNSDPTTRTHSVPEQNDKIQININKDSGVATYSDDSSGYDRRTIYRETDHLEENGIYVITFVKDDTEYILAYNMENSGQKQTAYSTTKGHGSMTYYNQIRIGGNGNHKHTVYAPFLQEAFPYGIEDSPGFYDSAYNQIASTNGIHYYDATDKQLSDIMFSGTNVLPEFQAVSATETGYWSLNGYNLNNYTSNKALGSIYNKAQYTLGVAGTNYSEDLQYDVFLFDVWAGNGLYYFQIEDNTGRYQDDVYLENVDLASGTYWKYSDSKLENDTYQLNAYNDNAKYMGISYPSETDTDQTLKIKRSPTGDTNKLYKMEDVYTKSELPGLNSFGDEAEQRQYSPSIISYTKSSQTVEGLKTSKTVTETNDPDFFHVKLEGYMTSRSLKLPTTDIVLVLDTSGRMDDTLYTRQYRNMKTQTMFAKTSLSSVTHDALFDKHNPRNQGQIDILPDRDYTDNKYVEDPNSPGTYVYLAQTYTFKNLRHYYQYSFTSTTGAVYTSPIYERRILGGIIGNINALTFTREGNAHASNSIRTVTLDSFYSRTGENADKALADRADLVSLYNYSISSKGLWYRHSDGNYYRVTVTRSDHDSTYDYYKTYTFSVTIEGKTYSVSYGNNIYGAKNSVFQGFKKYKTENGKLVVDLDESLPSKTLFTKENSPVTRLDAMKESIEDLLINISMDARTKGAKERVAVTTFSNTTTEKIPYHLGDVDMSDTRSVDNMISDIYGYTTTNAFFNFGGRIKTKKARIDVGTSAANTEFAENSPEGNKRYEVVFTAGVPTKSNNGSLDLSVANSAIANTYTTKTRFGANVYTVGLFHYADESHTHGDYFYYNSHPWFKCTGKVGSTWGVSTGYSWFGDKDITPVDADVTNRMLNYMSSNFGDASHTGLQTSALYNPGYLADPVTYFLSTHGRGYRIYRNYTRTDDGHYYGISPTRRTVTDNGVDNPSASETDLTADELEARFREVFKHIAQGLEAPLTELDPDTVLVDGITDYYDFEGADKNSIRVYAANINTGSEIQVNDSIEWALSSDKKNIEVTGFNYSDHYIGGSSPAKLVVEFDIRRTDNFIGGNRVPTNTANSAILDKNGHLEEKFNIPAIDLELRKDEDVAKDQGVYYSTEADLSKAFNLNDVNGKNNAYVDLVYDIYDASGENLINTYTISHGDSVGKWTNSEDSDLEAMYPVITEDTDYVIKCTVKPWLNGTISDEEHPSENHPTAHVYVFKPKLTATDKRIQKDADPVNVAALINKDIQWIPDTEGAVEPTGDAPALEYKIKDVTHNGSATNPSSMTAVDVDETTDYQIVDLKVAARTFNYEVIRWIEEDIPIEDENGNETGEVEHNEYWDNVSGSANRTAVPLSFEGGTPTAFYVNDKDLNSDKDTAPKGTYTVLISQPFTLMVQKVFTGDYAVPDDVTINVKNADGTVIGTHTFTANDFNQLKSDVVEVKPSQAGTTFDCEENYTISETDVDSEFYTASFIGTSSDNTVLADKDQADDTYTFSTNTVDDVVTVVVTNTWNTDKNPPVTGMKGNSKINPFFIAAAVVAILGGSGTAYMVKRKKETEA